MKTLMHTELPSLPSEVRALVADGVYSLYELPTEQPRYVLLTSQRTEYYFLSSSGEIVPAPSLIRSVDELTLGMPVAIRADSGSVRLNLGYG